MHGVEPEAGTAWPFGGTAVRLLRGATGAGSAFTGFILGVVLLTASFLGRVTHTTALGLLLGQVVLAAALARFALNGYSGEDRGNILSTAGGSWREVPAVAARYLTLHLLWIAPVLLLGWSAVASVLTVATASVPATSSAAVMLPILGLFASRAFLWSAGLLFFGMLFAPSVALIAAVRATSFRDLFRIGLWTGTFGGRLGDLAVLFVVQAGGVVIGTVAMLPVVLVGYAAGFEIGAVFTLSALGLLTGFGVSLLGRMCGFFAFGEERVVAPARTAAAEPELPEAAVTEAPPPVSETSTDARPPLLDAAAQVAAARKQAETDRDAGIVALEALRQAHAPHPLVLHALALLLRAAARPDAIGVAAEAIRLALLRGNTALATELFAAFWKEAKQLDLKVTEIDAIGAAFVKSGDLGQAAAAFGLALRLDCGDRQAVKGLMKIADQRLHREGRPKDAARIYTFLLQYAPGSSFAEDMKRGLAEAEGRLARAV